MTHLSVNEERPSPRIAPERQTGRPPLEIVDVVKQWHKRAPRILDGVDLRIERGQSVWVGGRNGVGKTTLLRIVSGLIDPDQGEVLAFGLHPVRDRREFHKRVHFLSAGNSGIYARLSVRRQIDCWARIAFVPRGERAAIVEDVLDRFAIRELAQQRSDRLSMGQRKRLKIAMAFIGDPDIVLLDEPRNSLDGEGGEILKQAIASVVDRGGAVLWCSPTGEHIDMEFDRRYVLDQGRLHPA